VFRGARRAGPARIASDRQLGVIVRGSRDSRVAVGSERRLRDTLILIAIVATPSVGIVLLGLAK
jgi:hypothetical protein